MRTMPADIQEEKSGSIGRENVNGILISGATTANAMSQYPYHANELTTKNQIAQHIRRRTAEAVAES